MQVRRDGWGAFNFLIWFWVNIAVNFIGPVRRSSGRKRFLVSSKVQKNQSWSIRGGTAYGHIG